MKKKRIVSAANGTPRTVNREAALVELRSTPSAPFKLKEEEIERWLLTGENADLLKRYFGERQYTDLQEMARSASTRSVRGGPRVLILPGIMGSTLGAPRALFFNDTIWIDPVDIATGGLLQLKLPDAKNRPLGVVLFSYLKLKLCLKLAGYNADFHPYDWRQSLDRLGPELAARLKDEGPDVSLVAHSMGGLVSRAAIAAGAKNVKNVIMLGTPNFGSYVAIQAIRGIYPVIRKIAMLDLKNSPEVLAQQVFNTFPGLYQLLPSPEKLTTMNVFDAGKWSGEAVPQPRQDLLNLSRRRQEFLAPADQRFFLIAGVNQETVTGIGSDGGQFTYTLTNEGDGTVPLAFAQIPDVRATYYVEESHGSLANNSKVIQAVKDLLALGTTDALPTTWSPQRAAPRTMTESEVRALIPDDAAAVRGAAVSDKEVRNILSELVAPATDEEVIVAPVARVESVDGLVVSRQLQRRLDIRLALGDITESSSKAYVLGIFSDVMPTGAAGAVDRQLDGAIADFAHRRMFSANVGEVFPVPTSCSRLRSDTVLLAGLGPFDRFTPETLEIVAENVIRTFIKTHVDEFATVLIGSSSGSSAEGVLERLLKGFVRGLVDADKRKDFRRVTICEMDPARFAKVREELYRLASSDLFDDIQVAFEEEKLPVAQRVERSGVPTFSGPEPVYLLVRQEGTEDGTTEIQTSVLSAGAKAAVVTARKRPSKQDLERLFDALTSPSLSKNIDKFGSQLTSTLISEDVVSILKTMKGRPLIVVNDLLASRYPWEAMRLDGWAPALEGGVVRRYLAENLSVAKWLESRQEAEILKMLLVVNPTKDLAGAEQEGARIKETLGSRPGIQIPERFEDQATKAALLKDFSSGQYDVIHYAGHAFFDPANPSRSGILCAGHQVLSGADIAGIGRLPNLIFFNACESGRVRSAQTKGGQKLLTINQQIERNVGLAEAFLRGGAANYVGTYWPVGDDSAKTFAEVFYDQLLKGEPLGTSIVTARKAVVDFSIDWADYIFYGSPEFVLKRKKSQ